MTKENRLNQIVLDHSFPSNKPLPSCFYNVERFLAQKDNITFCLFSEVCGQRRIMKIDGSEYFTDLVFNFLDFRSKEILGDIINEFLEIDTSADEIEVSADKIDEFYRITESEGKNIPTCFTGDDLEHDASWYWMESDLFNDLFNALSRYLKAEICLYEKYNPKWWEKEEVNQDRFYDMVTGLSVEEYLGVIRRSSIWKSCGFEEEDLDAIRLVSSNPVLLKLILTFALGKNKTRLMEFMNEVELF